MKGSFPVYLDLVRFTAAVLVVLEHSVLLGLLPRIPLLTGLSHESVIVFFVLSGLVIAASSSRPGMTGREYAAARAARVCSVAVPAVLVCYGAMALTRGVSPARLVSSLLFLDGVWFNFGAVPFNGPYWSLCYEVWYYVAWGIALFAPWPRIRRVLACLLLAVMGPAFAALAGIWLLGAVLSIQQDRIDAALRRVPGWAPPLVGALSLGAVLLIAASPLEDAVRDLARRYVHGWWRLRGSEYMVTDYAIGLLVAAHLAAARAWFGNRPRLGAARAGRAVRYWAGLTFTLYLFHYPILLALARLHGMSSPSMAAGVAALSATFAAVWLIACVTERQLPRWRRMFARALEAVPRAATRPVESPSPALESPV